MKKLIVWVNCTQRFTHGSVENVQKMHIFIEENTMHLTREDKLFNIGKALYEQKKIPAINLIAFK